MSGPVVISPESTFDPRVQISAEAYAHIQAISRAQSSLRVTIFAFAEVIQSGNIFLFNRIVLPGQRAAFRKSTMTPCGLVGLAKLFDECSWRGLDSKKLDGVLIMSPMKKKLLRNPDPDESGHLPFGSKKFVLTVVCNQKMELLARLERFGPRETYANIPVGGLKEPGYTAPLQMHLDVSAKVRKVKRIRKKRGKPQ